MKNLQKVIDMIGLAKRGGYITFGEDLYFKIKKKRVRLLLVAYDIGSEPRRHLETCLEDEMINTFEGMSKEELGDAISSRPINALGIMNSGIAKKIIELEKETDNVEKKEVLQQKK